MIDNLDKKQYNIKTMYIETLPKVLALGRRKLNKDKREKTGDGYLLEANNLTNNQNLLGGCSSVVEHFVANERVVGSNPITRSKQIYNNGL